MTNQPTQPKHQTTGANVRVVLRQQPHHPAHSHGHGGGGTDDDFGGTLGGGGYGHHGHGGPMGGPGHGGGGLAYNTAEVIYSGEGNGAR